MSNELLLSQTQNDEKCNHGNAIAITQLLDEGACENSFDLHWPLKELCVWRVVVADWQLTMRVLRTFLSLRAASMVANVCHGALLRPEQNKDTTTCG